MLAGLSRSSQIVEILLRTLCPTKKAGKNWQNVSSVKSLQWENRLNYISSNVFGKVKNSRNLNTTSKNSKKANLKAPNYA